MSKVDEMNHIYQLYVLNDKNIGETMKYTKRSKSTIIKYIKIIERLDFELLPLIDVKGSNKMTIDIALYIINHVQNFDMQLLLYDEIKSKNTKDKKIEIVEYSTCLICADTYPVFEILRCCNNKICEKCLFNIMETSINDISFTNIRCPFCNVIFDFITIKYYLIDNRNKCVWKKNDAYKSLHYLAGDSNIFTQDFHRTNLYRKFKNILHNILELSRIRRTARYNFNVFTDKLEELSSKKVFGVCDCCPKISDNKYDRYHPSSYKIKVIDKQCANDENEQVVINSDMFKCDICIKKEIAVIKKCPHCGVKTLKPDGCNYVKCACKNFWCFVCNHRLPNSYEGHNSHFHIGPGTSAHDDNCRVSVNYHNEWHIKKSCNCKYCIKRNQLSLCCEIDCNRKVIDTGVKCALCQ